MSTVNIADQLLRGSENTDIMKAKIENLVRMMIGFAQKTVSLKEICMDPIEKWNRPTLITESHSCKWEMWVLTEDGGPRFNLDCHVLDYNVWVLAYDTATTPIKNHMALVMYENREQFVEGMLAAFPKIKKLDSWQSLINAGNMEL